MKPKQLLKITFRVILFVFLPVAVIAAFTSKVYLFGFRSYVVLSGSMEPHLPTGSLVLVRQSPRYNLGDVIAFTNSSGLSITHRVIAQDASHVRTMGDANTTPDSALILKSQIIGKEVIFVPYFGYFSNFLKTPFGFILFIVLPSFIFILSEVRKIKSELEHSIEKKLLSRYHLPPV